MAAKFGARSSGQVPVARSGMSNNNTTSSADSFIPYEGREKLKIWNLDIEKSYEEFVTVNQVRLFLKFCFDLT